VKLRRQGKRMRSTYVTIAASGRFAARAVDGRTGREGVATRKELSEAATGAQHALRNRTGFDDFFDEQMANPSRAKMYRQARSKITGAAHRK
jgi:hypothetical protein